jgi:hypothetical protein
MPVSESPQPGLEQLTAQELLAAITPSEGEPEVEGFHLGQFKTAILGELNRRLGDPDLVKDIPGTGLIQLAKELLKQPEKPVETGEDTRSILDTLDALPPAHARKLLQREIDRATGELARYTARMEELVDV